MKTLPTNADHPAPFFAQPINHPERLLRLAQVLAPEGPIPVSPATWWRGVKDGRFPAPIKLGPRMPVWRESDIARLGDRSDPRDE